MLKRIFALGFGTAVLAFSASFANAGTLDNIKARHKLIVAVLQDYPPWGSVGPDMKPIGIDIDVAKYMAKRLGVDVEVVPVTGANRIPFMQTGKVDIIIAELGKTDERAKVITYANPYMAEILGVFGEEGTEVTKPEDLVKYKIGAPRGGTEDLAVTKIAPPGTDIQRFEDTASTLGAYAAGQVDLIASGASTVKVFNQTSPRKAEMKLKTELELAYIGVPLGDEEMKNVVDETITAAAQDGTLKELAAKYLGDASAADVAK